MTQTIDSLVMSPGGAIVAILLIFVVMVAVAFLTLQPLWRHVKRTWGIGDRSLSICQDYPDEWDETEVGDQPVRTKPEPELTRTPGSNWL